MKNSGNRTLQKILIVVFVFLFGFSVTANDICMANANTITGALNQKDYVVENTGDGTENAEYFQTGYASIRDLVYGGYLIQMEEQTEGTVLLKNDHHVLPLAKGANVTLFGGASGSPNYGAGGSGGIISDNAISWVEAFDGVHYEKENSAIKTAKVPGTPYLNVNRKMADQYTAWTYSPGRGDPTPRGEYAASGFMINEVPMDVIRASEGYQDLPRYGDAAIMIIKRAGGEGSDLPATSSTTPGEYSIDHTTTHTTDGTNGDYLQLSPQEKEILAGLKEEKDQGNIKSIILILNMANTIQLDFLVNDEYGIDACIWAGAVGEFGTISVARLLVGEDNFSGGLSATLWTDNLLNPVNSNITDQNYYFQYENYGDFGFTEDPANNHSSFTTYIVYQEGMYMGYKYTETRYEDYVNGRDKAGDFQYGKVVAYPFGYGLSYTDFRFDNMNVTRDGSDYVMKVDVTNTGSVAGKTPVQVYAAKPYGDYEKQNRIQVPSVQLVEFGKTKKLEPGEKQTVEIRVPEKNLRTYDTFGAGTYVLTPGDYQLIVAHDAHAAVNSLLAFQGKTPANTDGRMDAEGRADLVYGTHYELDASTYAYSDRTQLPIENSFEFADINTYAGKGDNSVVYMSRDDWEGTVHLCTRTADGKLVKPYEKLLMTQALADDLRDQMNADKVIVKGGEYPTYGADNGLRLIDLMNESYDSPMWDQLLDQMTWQETVHLLSNGRHKTVAVESIAKPAGEDENGPNGFNLPFTIGELEPNPWCGIAPNPYAARINDPDLSSRYEFTGFSSNGILAATFNRETAAKVGKQIGEEGFWAGNSGILGVGLNIQRSPYIGRAAEYFSEDAMLSGLITIPEVQGIESMGIHTYLKHCAMNESETARHGVQVWTTEQTLRENYFRAFELAIAEGGSYNVMTSFSRMGPQAVANCVNFAQRFLRNECGMPGIVETDCAGDMTDGAHGEAYISRIVNVYTQATDLNEYDYADDATDYTGGTHTFQDYAPKSAGGSGEYGNVGQSMRESTKRILYAVVHSNAMSGYSANTRIVKITPPWQNWMKAAMIGFGVLSAAAIAWFVLCETRRNRKAA